MNDNFNRDFVIPNADVYDDQGGTDGDDDDYDYNNYGSLGLFKDAYKDIGKLLDEYVEGETPLYPEMNRRMISQKLYLVSYSTALTITALSLIFIIFGWKGLCRQVYMLKSGMTCVVYAVVAGSYFYKARLASLPLLELERDHLPAAGIRKNHTMDRYFGPLTEWVDGRLGQTPRSIPHKLG